MNGLGWIFLTLTFVYAGTTFYALAQWRHCIDLLHEAGRLNQAYANLLRDQRLQLDRAVKS